MVATEAVAGKDSMRRRKDGLHYEPMYKPKPPQPAEKERRSFAARLRIYTLGLVGKRRKGKGAPTES
jgi:hypothetical protein